MASWLTTHYPHPIGIDHPWHIYLQRQHLSAVDGIAANDRVFFYEFANQKPIDDGNRYSRGRQGIVHVAYVSGPLYRRSARIEYSDGSTADYSGGVPTHRGEEDGFVSRAALCRLLGYRAGYRLRGFAGGSGVKILDDDVADELYRLFRSGRRLPYPTG